MHQPGVPELDSSQEAAAIRRFEDRSSTHLKRFFPRHCSLLGDAQIRLVSRLGWRRSGQYGLTEERCRRSYVEFMCLLGSGFDSDVLLPWARDTLIDRTTTSQIARVDRLYDRVWDYVGHIARDYRDAKGQPITARFVEEIRALRRESDLTISDDGFPAFSHSLDQRLQRLFPAKYAYVGHDRVRRLISQARVAAQAYRITSERGVTVFAGQLFVLGGGFDRDPLLPWAFLALNDPRISEPAARVDRLLFAAVAALRKWWDSAPRRRD